jgi:Type I restriction modification DNA specificity domain
MLRKQRGAVQTGLNLEDLKSIPILRMSQNVEEAIAQMVRDACERRNSSQSLYASMQRILEEELCFDKIDLSSCVGYESHLFETFHARRWDSEFYKPKYKQVVETVLNAKKVRVERFIPVGRLLPYLTNGHTPLHHDLTVGEVPFLTAEHVSDFRVDFGTDKRILQRHHETELARTDLREGDILVTIKGKVGNCAVVRNCPKTANINQDVALIRLRNGIHPYFFAAWFNSLMGKQLVEQRSTGGINPFLGLGNLKGMPFPVVSNKEQQRIGNLVQETVERAHSAEREASNLLQNAKRRVEELIEQGAATDGRD